MGRDGLPPYDPLTDPHLADYFARKFGWTSVLQPPPASARSQQQRSRAMTEGARMRPKSAPAQPADGGCGGGEGRKFYLLTSTLVPTAGAVDYEVQIFTSKHSSSSSKCPVCHTTAFPPSCTSVPLTNLQLFP